ncbi:Transposase, partial [Paucidesulfovibrio gracilis DSM 16080]
MGATPKTEAVTKANCSSGVARRFWCRPASAERYYHQVITNKASHRKNKIWPRILGIDEHRFTRRKGFLTTFCDLGKHKVLDIAEGRSELELQTFLNSMKGRKKVEVVCIDLNSAYRKMV